MNVIVKLNDKDNFDIKIYNGVTEFYLYNAPPDDIGELLPYNAIPYVLDVIRERHRTVNILEKALKSIQHKVNQRNVLDPRG